MFKFSTILQYFSPNKGIFNTITNVYAASGCYQAVSKGGLYTVVKGMFSLTLRWLRTAHELCHALLILTGIP